MDFNINIQPWSRGLYLPEMCTFYVPNDFNENLATNFMYLKKIGKEREEKTNFPYKPAAKLKPGPKPPSASTNICSIYGTFSDREASIILQLGTTL